MNAIEELRTFYGLYPKIKALVDKAAKKFAIKEGRCYERLHMFSFDYDFNGQLESVEIRCFVGGGDIERFDMPISCLLEEAFEAA